MRLKGSSLRNISIRAKTYKKGSAISGFSMNKSGAVDRLETGAGRVKRHQLRSVE